jgi:hypothetical protein
MTLKRYDWQPGNGTRYDLCYGPVGDRALVTWLRQGGSGGPSLAFSHYLHYTYVMEKMSVNIADAVGILKFLEEMGHDVGYPTDTPYEFCIGASHIQVLD